MLILGLLLRHCPCPFDVDMFLANDTRLLKIFFHKKFSCLSLQNSELLTCPRFQSFRITICPLSLMISNNYILCSKPSISASIYLLKVNNKNTRIRCKIRSKLIKTPKQRHWRRSGVFIVVNFFHTFSSISIVNFEHLIAGWDRSSVWTIRSRFTVRHLTIFYYPS